MQLKTLNIPTVDLQLLRQAKTSPGRHVEVPPVEGALIMNIGDLLERWSGGEFRATEYRVKVPESSRYCVPISLNLVRRR